MQENPLTYQPTPSSLLPGQNSGFRADSTANILSSLGTRIAGEDLTNDVLKSRYPGNSTYISTATTTVCKGGAGHLHSITLTETAAGTITIYDNTAASGTILAVFKASIVEGTYPLDLNFGTGLTIVTAGASKLTAIWS